MELSIAKSRIELVKTYFRFLFSWIFDDFRVKTVVLFHFCDYRGVKNRLEIFFEYLIKNTKPP